MNVERRREIGRKFFMEQIKNFQEKQAREAYVKGRFHGNKPNRHLTNVPGRTTNPKALTVVHKAIQKKPSNPKKRKRG